MLNKYTRYDLRVGDILTTRAGKKYVVVRGDAEGKAGYDCLSLNGEGQVKGLYANLTLEYGDIPMFVGRKHSKNKEIVLVERFKTKCGVDALSEAVKYYTGRRFESVKNVIYREPDKVDYDEDAMDDLKDAFHRLMGDKKLGAAEIAEILIKMK